MCHFSQEHASLIVSMLFIGTLVGGPSIGWFSLYINNRLLMIFGALFSLALILIIMTNQRSSMIVYQILFLLLGFTTSTQIISYQLVAESNVKTVRAMSESVILSFFVGSYAIFHPLFGWLLDWYSNEKILLESYYTNIDFERALLIIPMGFIIAISVSLLLQEPSSGSS
jgi:MFS family permease